MGQAARPYERLARNELISNRAGPGKAEKWAIPSGIEFAVNAEEPKVQQQTVQIHPEVYAFRIEKFL